MRLRLHIFISLHTNLSSRSLFGKRPLSGCGTVISWYYNIRTTNLKKTVSTYIKNIPSLSFLIQFIFITLLFQLRYMIDKLMDIRKASKKQLADNPALTIGDVTTVNLTMLSVSRNQTRTTEQSHQGVNSCTCMVIISNGPEYCFRLAD